MFTTHVLYCKKCNCKVSLTFIHWSTFKLNDKDMVLNDEKAVFKIHDLQNYGNLFKFMYVTFLREKCIFLIPPFTQLTANTLYCF